VSSNLEEMDRRRMGFQQYLKPEHFFKMSDPQRKQLLEAWKMDKNLTNKMVFEALELTQGEYYKELRRLGIPTRERAPQQRRQKLAGDPKKLEGGCKISFNSIYDPQQLLESLDRIKMLLDPEAFAYKISVNLEEIAE
jgi:hypothetical protein